MNTIEERIHAANSKLAEIIQAEDQLRMQEWKTREELNSLMIQEYRQLVGVKI